MAHVRDITKGVNTPPSKDFLFCLVGHFVTINAQSKVYKKVKVSGVVSCRGPVISFQSEGLKKTIGIPADEIIHINLFTNPQDPHLGLNCPQIYPGFTVLGLKDFMKTMM